MKHVKRSGVPEMFCQRDLDWNNCPGGAATNRYMYEGGGLRLSGGEAARRENQVRAAALRGPDETNE